ncbi:citrate lyase acyl carrier protein [Candidatus Epulonipiscium fishelsonii]|uniref:Citrate lyase acyl carrier protein n=1 Tax=Candidatus Epulonipiscium fishelsonii TaxID=77094 RepID=A0ACC8XIX3_9FIRM|nr:citrate lyase acyl carrier protein [Epulopiscium sp. SCG-D08WGA-EpuloA1]OON97945.1 MAG: citrate lyase acyl carrier protein [Epulopiscium sp. AS2M-Bin002]
MELKITATAGTLESSDIQIILEPSDGGIEIELESTVKAQFGEQIEKVIKGTLRSMDVRDAKVTANDKGAIDPVIISRMQTAIYRSAQNTNYKWV